MSSTFSDLKAERNALHRTAFPALKRLCEEHGARFQAIDLRWGVREEAALDQQTMRICLDEVKRCQQVTPKPNFLLLLGDRYGWRPLPAEIPTAEWEEIAKGLSGDRLKRLEEWYRLDLNAATENPPGAWLLKPRTEAPYNDAKIWETEVERPLREILIEATSKLAFSAKARLKYGASATEQEISRGALEVPDSQEHVFCFFRTIGNLPASAAADGFRDLVFVGASSGQPGELIVDTEAGLLLDRLKGPHGTLRTAIQRSENFFESHAEWLPLPRTLTSEEWIVLRSHLAEEIAAARQHGAATSAEPIERLRALVDQWYEPGPSGSAHLGSRFDALDEAERIDLERRLRHAVFHDQRPPITIDHLPKLCQDVERVLGEVIRKEIARLDDQKARARTTDLDEEIAAHERFAMDRLRSKQDPDRSFFTGREAALRRIADYLSSEDAGPLALVGEPGSGKSAVMAQAVEDAAKAHPGALVVSRFIAWTPGSAVIRDLLDKLCRQISRAYPPAGEATPGDYREVVQEFPKRLALATKEKPLLLFLDAVDQLSEADNARNLIWLPRELPPHVRLVVSTSTDPGDTEAVLKRNLPPTNRLSLDDMSVEEAHRLLGNWFDDVGRTLQGRGETPARSGAQWKYVLDRFQQCPRPFYLKLAFEEARRWRSFDALPKTQLDSDIQGLIAQLFAELSTPDRHGETVLAASLGYLMAARYGLTEDEMLDVLARDDAVLAEVKTFHRPPEEKLPVVLWSRLYFDLQPYLAERRADATSLFAFYHRQLDQVARERFLAPVRGARHRALAKYFAERELFLGEARRPNLRMLSELPYQQTHAGDMWNELYQTLTNFEFLEAKCTHIAVTEEGSGAEQRKVYGGVYELQEDYRRALEAFPAE